MTSLPRQINRVGTTKRRWNDYQAESRLAVVRRCGGKCEGCGAKGLRLKWHHAFGRRNVVAEPLASHPAMTCGLCDECHRTVHAMPEGGKNRDQRLMALRRAGELWGIGFDNLDPVGDARALETMLREDGTWETLREEAGL